jgi:hypothetical protein
MVNILTRLHAKLGARFPHSVFMYPTRSSQKAVIIFYTAFTDSRFLQWRNLLCVRYELNLYKKCTPISFFKGLVQMLSTRTTRDVTTA